MALLDNPKHEAYAGFLSRNMPQGKSYAKAGYTPNAGAASKLAAQPLIKARTAELRKENSRAIVAFMDDVSIENAQTLMDLGLTRQWCAVSFHEIYTKSVEDGQYSAANAAVVNIQKLIDIESGGGKDKNNDSKNLVDLREVTKMLSAAKDLLSHEIIKDVEPGADAVEIN